MPEESIITRMQRAQESAPPKHLFVKQNVRFMEEHLDPAEDIIVGIERIYEAEDERWRVLHAYAYWFDRIGQGYVARDLQRHIERHKDECLSAGVCPYCGEDVAPKTEMEHHPAPFGEGTATEKRVTYVCSGTCGEV